jgi:hypothetical protein
MEAAEASSSTSTRVSTVPGAAVPRPHCWKDAASRALVSNGPQHSPSNAHNKKGKKSWHDEDEKNSQSSHSEMNLLLKERIRHFTWTWFCMTMATGGIANVLYVSVSLLSCIAAVLETKTMKLNTYNYPTDIQFQRHFALMAFGRLDASSFFSTYFSSFSISP